MYPYLLSNISELCILSQCINSIVSLITQNVTKSIFAVSGDYVYDYPVSLFNLEVPLVVSKVDRAPDVFVVDLDRLHDFRFIIESSSWEAIILLVNITDSKRVKKNQIIDNFELSDIKEPKYLFNKKKRCLNFTIHSFTTLIDVHTAFNYHDLKKGVMICSKNFPPHIICPQCTEKKGYTVELLDIIFNMLNISFTHKFLGNSPLTSRVYHFLSNGSCDIIIGIIPPDLNHLGFFFIHHDYDIWVLPRSEEVSRSKYLLKVFSPQIWIVWIISVCISCIVWNHLDTLWYPGKTERNGNKIVNSFRRLSIIIKLFLEQTVRLGVAHWSQLIFFYVIIFLSFMMNALYKGRYTFLLLAPNYHPNDVQTFQDMIDRKLYLSFAPFRRDAIISAFPEFENYPESLFSNVLGAASLDKVAFQRKTAILMSFDEVRYNEKYYTDSEGQSLLQLVHSLKINLLIGSVFLKKNTYFYQFSENVNRLRDHGFEHYFRAKYESRGYDRSRDGKKQRHEKIKPKHLRGPITLLVLGLLLGALSCSIEILLHEM
ncbi:hypothetical protein HHI36_012594 [Cryptolaemus montrouzieri]|uniref:Uncharacterized protein n=1 Tax=Cryptolaemus montrouzieri TaxID=559131 RepID=A0ABD2NES7_9CUCU